MADIKSIGGNPIVLGMDGLDEDVLDVLDTKADIDGYYAQLTAGAADNLTGRGDATTAEFLYRTAGGTADIETGQAVAKSVKGNTLVWNQLSGTGFIHSDNANVSMAFNTTTGKLTIVVAQTPSSNDDGNFNLSDQLTLGHKYLFKPWNRDDTAGPQYYLVNQAGVSQSIPSAAIFTANEYNSGVAVRWRIRCTPNCPTGTYECYPQLFDLTQMFGAGNEPSTVAEFEALYPEPYYEYDAGSLLSVNMEGIETVGFNQWDEQWELGTISGTTGENADATTVIRSKNYIPVLPNAEYYFKCGSVVGQQSNPALRFYDADKNFIGVYAVSGAITPTNSVFTVPANAHYIRFNMQTTYGTTYKGDICINLSWSGRRNGEYEPFWSSQRLIDVDTYFPDGMRSAGSVRDELTSTEAITRVGVVDLGTVDWKATGASGCSETTGKFVSDVAIRGKTNMSVPDIATDAPYTARNFYGGSSSAYDIDKSISIGYTSGGVLLIHDTNLANKSATEVKAALAGKMLYYALATPIVTPIDPPLNLSYRVDDFGTERIMVPEDERSAPPVLDIAYGLNVVDFVRRAPSEYMSHASFQQFCIALQAKLGIVITETWNDTDNRYEYSIADTVTEG